MDSISSTAEDYLKVIWSALEWGGDPVTIKELAARFGISAASASDTVKRLVGQGLVLHEPYRPISLTAAGEQQAVRVVRRHRLIETFLVAQLGYSWDEVHDEAEALEHAVSDLMIDRMDALLGCPKADPHGDPIPNRSGEVEYPDAAIRVTDADPGKYTVIRISDDDSAQLAVFEAAGLVTNVVVQILDRDNSGTTRVLLPGGELALTAEETDAVIVVPVDTLVRTFVP
jgi:DtxR family Mn-dependent transcriptional regulator